MSDEHGNTGKINAARRRQHAQEALRVKINGEKHIASLESLSDQAKSAEKDAIPALKLQADISLALLKKVLPDLRHVELSGDEERPLRITVARYSGE